MEQYSLNEEHLQLHAWPLPHVFGQRAGLVGFATCPRQHWATTHTRTPHLGGFGLVHILQVGGGAAADRKVTRRGLTHTDKSSCHARPQQLASGSRK